MYMYMYMYIVYTCTCTMNMTCAYTCTCTLSWPLSGMSKINAKIHACVYSMYAACVEHTIISSTAGVKEEEEVWTIHDSQLWQSTPRITSQQQLLHTQISTRRSTQLVCHSANRRFSYYVCPQREQWSNRRDLHSSIHGHSGSRSTDCGSG